MIYAFEDVELDIGRVELRRAGGPVPVEPQVFALLGLLVENHDRMVSRDEIIERIWEGRVVSEAAISSRVKAARRAVGDDGTNQVIIKTVHGRGFRCVAEVRIAAEPIAAAPEPDLPLSTPVVPKSERPSIAVLPFQWATSERSDLSLGDAISHEIINTLSRVRWLRVISRGSSFRFRERDPEVRDVGRILGVRYCVTGLMTVDGAALTLSVELADARDGAIVWSDTYRGRLEDVQAVRGAISNTLVAMLERQLAINEALAAQTMAPESLDAWGFFHLGLQRLFRFSAKDNAAAAGFFNDAIERQPGFARAYAGVSFTAFQDAYLGYTADREESAKTARRMAEQAVSFDPQDPFANLTLGRSFWLSGDIETSLGLFARSTQLSPSFAQGVYAHAWAETMLGRASAARSELDNAMGLSPLDPFLYAMKGTRALGHLTEGQLDEAGRWIDEAGRTPGANAVVYLVAAIVHEMRDERDVALGWVKGARARNPHIDSTQLFQALPFAERAVRHGMASSLARLGID